jgi:hypothetical protein
MKNLLTLLLLLAFTRAMSQDSLAKYNYLRDQVTTSGMKVLGSWGLVNLGVGVAGWAGSKEGRSKYFYQMTTLWGAVNTGVAALGLAGITRNQKARLDKAGSLKAQQIIEKTFLINGGIDFVYIGAGIYLNSRGNKRDDVKQKGYGSAVIMQGVFLLLFDATMYKLQTTNGRKMRKFLDKNAISFSGNRAGITHSF